MSRKYHRLTFELEKLQRVYETKFALQRDNNHAEQARLKELLEAERHRREIDNSEWRDRFLDALGANGIRYATTDVESRIKELRYQPFENAAAAKTPKITAKLATDERADYEQRYENHVLMGRAAGYSDEHIAQVWRDSEDDTIAEIQREFGNAGIGNN